MENKTGKYFKYAIGEIVLVVIGILIALQINNWNENRKENFELNNYLKSLNQEIDTNIKIIENGVNSSIRMQKICRYYQNKFITKTPEKVKDSAITNFIFYINPLRPFKPSKAVLNDLISSGNISNIEDAGLKNRILVLESVYNSYEEIIKESDERYRKNIEGYLDLNSDYSELTAVYSKVETKKGEFKHIRSAFLNNRILSNNLLFYIAMLQSIEEQSKSQIEGLKRLKEKITKAQQRI